MVYVRLLDNIVVGLYFEDIHGITECEKVIESGGIKIPIEVWYKIRTWYKIKFIGEKLPDKTYTLADFEEIKRPIIPPEKNQLEIMQDKILIQDELINVTMMATDEIFVMIEPLLAAQPAVTTTRTKRSLREVKQPMVDLYVAMVIRGLKTIDEVPARYREQVKDILAQLEK